MNTQPTYSDHLSLGEAREQFFASNGFSVAAYDERWVKLKMGPIPLAFPNTAARKRAVKLHDLHHILADYDTDWPGEVQISAWELGAGCGRHWAAWALNLSGMLMGLMRWPRLTMRAWRRGRRCNTLYRGEFHPALLNRTVGELRRDLALAESAGAP